MNRSIYFDNAKGCLAVLVVLGHFTELMRHNVPIAGHVSMFIYIFHMPMFVLLSGYFSRAEVGWGAVRKGLIRVFLPYLFFQLVLVAITYCCHPMTHRELGRALLTPQGALWYLFCLFWWRLSLPYFLKMPTPVAMALLLGLLGGFLPRGNLLFSSSRMMAFFPFFVLGYYLRIRGDWLARAPDQRISSNMLAVPAYVLVLLLTLTGAILLNGRHRTEFCYVVSYFQSGSPLWFSVLFRLLTYAAALLAGFSFLRLVPKTHSFVSQIGARSLYVYLLHSLLLYTFWRTGVLKEIHDLGSVIVISLSSVPLAYLLATNLTRQLTRFLIEPETVLSWVESSLRGLIDHAQREGRGGRRTEAVSPQNAN